jgi:MoaA/NifB/PqqE/SkfB family radical SAM enzyme
VTRESEADFMNIRAQHNSLVNYVERKLGRIELSSLPVILQVELSSSCNLSCSICARSEFEYGPGHLSLPHFESLTFLFPILKRLILHGYGEPMIHPDFVEIMELVSSYSCHKSFYTNGTLLSGRRAEAVFTGHIDEVAVSVDSPKKADFERIRKGASFDRVFKNIEEFIRERKRRRMKTPKVVIAAVAMKDNVDDLVELVDLVSDLGADELEVNYLMAYKKPLVERSLYFDQERSNETLRAVKRRARELGISVRLPDRFTTDGRVRRPKPVPTCPRPYDFAYVGYDGSVRPCCFPLLFLGTILEESFLDIWNGGKYQKLRRAFHEGRPPAFCRECLSGTYTHVDSEKCHISCEWG